MKEVICGIYKIQSLSKPERIYIGSSVSVKDRWKTHKKRLREDKHENGKVQHHFNKYGINDLVFSILVTCEKEDLIRHEQFFIDSLNPWFNIRIIANSNLGLKHSEETKLKMREAQLGEKSHRYGKHHSEETKAKMRDANLGEKSYMYGKPGNMLGKHHSEKTKAKIRVTELKSKSQIRDARLLGREKVLSEK